MLRAVALGLLILLPATATPAKTIDAQVIVSQATEAFVRPAYKEFHAATKALHEGLDDLCAQPSGSSLGNARHAFSRAVAAWSQVEIIRFGPVTQDNRLERILFWPDRKGIGLKQVQKLLASEDASAADAGELQGKSVALQGLGALEFLLFATDAEGLAQNSGTFRCAYGAAIAKNLDKIADALEAQWADPNGFAGNWSKPGPDNPLYHNDDEALTELLEVFVNGLELVRDQRLGGFLGKSHEDDRPRQAAFWRSGNTANGLAGNIRGMKALFDASGIAATLPDEKRWIVQSIDFEFGNAINAATAVEGPIAEALDEPKQRSKLAYFGLVTSSLSELFGTRLAGELGLTAGFSSLDGD